MFKNILPPMPNRLRWISMLLVISGLVLVPRVAQAESPASSSAQADEAEWLIMIYSDADDNVLEEELLLDLQEAELIGSTAEVTIVAQTDRLDGGYSGMGDWTGAKRYFITQDDDMSSFGSEELEDLGEVNMAEGATLLDFIEWAVSSFPARKRMLILSDHGAGWPGGWSDPDPGGPGSHDIFLADAMEGDNLWLMELDQTLEQARSNLGLDTFDVIGFDACLMSQLEVYTALAPHAMYAVGSEEVEPGLGWAYAGFLGRLADNPEMGGDELVRAIVESYIDEDMRLEDPTYAGNLTRAQVAAEITPEITLTGVDLTQIEPLNDELNNFVSALATMDQNVVAAARTYAQSYESIFGDEFPSPYIDLGHFAQLIYENTDDPAVQDAAQSLEAARESAIVVERHGHERPGSTGIAIYFPVRDLHSVADNLGYIDVADRFAASTQWDEFLAFHSGDTSGGSFARPAPPLFAVLQEVLTGVAEEDIQSLADDIAAMIDEGFSADEITQTLAEAYGLPEEVGMALADAGLIGAAPVETVSTGNNAVRKPLQVAPITLSAQVTYPGEPVAIDTEISGDRVGYIYSFIGRFLPEDDVLIIEDQDYLFAEQDAAVGGVTYPQWPEGTFGAGYDWEPIVYAVSDGTTSIRALLAPETYGDQPTYSVDGIYTFADGSPDRYARLFFQEGELSQAFAFTGSDGFGAPREITPQPGDQFTVFEQGYNLADDAEDEYYSAPIGTLTFGDESFFIEETPAPSGNYMVGVIAEDLDGNQVEAYEDLFVVGEETVTEEGFVPLVDEDLGFALLYPDTWAPADAGDAADRVTLDHAGGTAQMTISVHAYGDETDSADANLSALDDILAEFAESAGIENLELVDEPVDYTLGLYDAQLLDFTFEADGVEYWGEIVAATPTPGLTYVVDFVAPADEADALLPDLDAVLYSFGILYPSVDAYVPVAAQPEFADVYFVDEYDDAASGLYDDETESDWGMGFYDTEAGQYVYVMNPASGAIYDYYGDIGLPDDFMLQVSAQTAGALDTAYGLIFQVQDDAHFYIFRVSGDGYFLVEKADGDILETLVDWTPADMLDLEEEAVNSLAVVGAGGIYDLYVNGVQVGQFADDAYTAGSAGYMVDNFDEAEPAAFGFDDFVIGAPAE